MNTSPKIATYTPPAPFRKHEHPGPGLLRLSPLPGHLTAIPNTSIPQTQYPTLTTYSPLTTGTMAKPKASAQTPPPNHPSETPHTQITCHDRSQRGDSHHSPGFVCHTARAGRSMRRPRQSERCGKPTGPAVCMRWRRRRGPSRRGRMVGGRAVC